MKNMSVFLFVVSSSKVAFSSRISTLYTSKDGQTVVFNDIISNVGSGYNNQDGVFTAPADGVYVFFCKITQATSSHDMFLPIYSEWISYDTNLGFWKIGSYIQNIIKFNSTAINPWRQGLDQNGDRR